MPTISALSATPIIGLDQHYGVATLVGEFKLHVPPFGSSPIFPRPSRRSAAEHALVSQEEILQNGKITYDQYC